jgi:hypothetical protein
MSKSNSNSNSSVLSNSCDTDVKCKAIKTKRKTKQDKITCYIDILKEKYNISDDEIEKLLTLITPKKRIEKNEEEKPKKTNGYQLYMRVSRETNKTLKFKEIGEAWSNEDEDIKETYKERANKQNTENGFTTKSKAKTESKESKEEPKKTNGYQLYMREARESDKTLKFKEIGEAWSNEDKEIKETYKEKANKQNTENGFTTKSKAKTESESKAKTESENESDSDSETESDNEKSKPKVGGVELYKFYYQTEKERITKEYPTKKPIEIKKIINDGWAQIKKNKEETDKWIQQYKH